MKILYPAFFIAVLLSGLPIRGQEAGYVIIAHPEVKEDGIERSELKSLFLGRKQQWEDGTRVVLAFQVEKSAFESFSKEILSKTMRQYIMFWRRIIMTGRGSMPKQFTTVEETIQFVTQTKGAVAVINPPTQLIGVKKIEIK